MGASSQATTRKAVAALFSAALTGNGKPLEAVYDYKIGVFSGSPVLLVTSGRTWRKQAGMNVKKYKSVFELVLMIFVADADDSWTEQMVDDTLDAIEASIADVVAENRSSASWDYLHHSEDGGTVPLGLTVNGHAYQMRMVSVMAEVSDA